MKLKTKANFYKIDQDPNTSEIEVTLDLNFNQLKDLYLEIKELKLDYLVMIWDNNDKMHFIHILTSDGTIETAIEKAKKFIIENNMGIDLNFSKYNIKTEDEKVYFREDINNICFVKI